MTKLPRRQWPRLREFALAGPFLARAAGQMAVLLVFCAVAFVHARFIFTHFSSDGYLYDSGWFAYLFEAADPLLRNPSGVNELSYYAHHLSPYLFVFGAPFSLLFGLTGIQIFALHQALFFGLLFIALAWLVAAPRLSYRDMVVGILSAISIGALSHIVWQAAAYPHFEIALTAVSSLGLAARLRGHRRLFFLCLLVLPFIREDGGFYAAFVCLACIAIEEGGLRGPNKQTRVLAALALGGIAASVLSLYLKTRLFPGFETFAGNFAGHSWSHVSWRFVADRIRAMVTNLGISPILVGSLVLAIFDLRYLAGLVLLFPLILLHVLSVRDEIGLFTLYYALPWLLPCAIWLAVFARRAARATVPGAEAAIILLSSIVITAPVHAGIGVERRFWRVAQTAAAAPVAGIDRMKAFSLWTKREYVHADGKNCVSVGIAALIPNGVASDEVLEADSDLAPCGSVLLMRGDMSYLVLRERVEAGKFQHSAVSENAELWTRPATK